MIIPILAGLDPRAKEILENAHQQLLQEVTVPEELGISSVDYLLIQFYSFLEEQYFPASKVAFEVIHTFVTARST